MKKSRNLSGRSLTLAALLAALIFGVVYYLGFYKPMEQELARIAVQTAQVDNQISEAAAKAARMEIMQAELDEIFAEGDVTEIAPYDNKEVVLSQLNGILQESLEYSLNFAEPSIQEDGTVRRNVTMSFRCGDFASAEAIVRNLTGSQWRCLVSNLALSGSEDILEGEVQVNATITFLESTRLNIR